MYSGFHGDQCGCTTCCPYLRPGMPTGNIPIQWPFNLGFVPSRQGWHCPDCGVAHSPDCLSCPNRMVLYQQPYVTYTSGTGLPIPNTTTVYCNTGEMSQDLMTTGYLQLAPPSSH